MIDEILIECGIGETRWALIEHGRLAELMIDRQADGGLVGDVYLGRVVRIERALQAAFVDIGLARAGLLGARDARRLAQGGDIANAVDEGEAVAVQIRRPPLRDKGAKLSADIGLPGRLLVYHPRRDGVTASSRIIEPAERARLLGLAAELGEAGGFVLRTAAVGAAKDALAAEAAELHRCWREIEAAARRAKPPSRLHRDLEPVARALRDHAGPELRRVLFDTPAGLARAKAYAGRAMPEVTPRLALYDGTGALFDLHDVEADIDVALQPRVPLASGGALTIEHTEALTAIDVDSGASLAGRGPVETGLATNLEAAAEIARQLRLRAIGGNVVIDFMAMGGPKDARRLRQALSAAFAADRADVQIAPLGELGLVALTRQQSGTRLADLMVEPDPPPAGRARTSTLAAALAATLRRALREAAAGRPGPIKITCAPDLAAALAGAPLAELGRRAGRAVRVVAEPALAPRRAEVAIG